MAKDMERTLDSRTLVGYSQLQKGSYGHLQTDMTQQGTIASCWLIVI